MLFLFLVSVFNFNLFELLASILEKGLFNVPCFIFSGLGRLSQAEEYLAQAQWTVLKTPDCTDGIKSKLFRNLGLLYAAQGNYTDALSQLADDVRL